VTYLDTRALWPAVIRLNMLWTVGVCSIRPLLVSVPWRMAAACPLVTDKLGIRSARRAGPVPRRRAWWSRAALPTAGCPPARRGYWPIASSAHETTLPGVEGRSFRASPGPMWSAKHHPLTVRRPLRARTRMCRPDRRSPPRTGGGVGASATAGQGVDRGDRSAHHSTSYPYICPSGSAMSSMRAPSGRGSRPRHRCGSRAPRQCRLGGARSRSSARAPRR
jgi:hypothetical protein